MTVSESSTTVSDIGPTTTAPTTTTLAPAPPVFDTPLVIGAVAVLLIATLLVVWRTSRGDRG